MNKQIILSAIEIKNTAIADAVQGETCKHFKNKTFDRIYQKYYKKYLFLNKYMYLFKIN